MNTDTLAARLAAHQRHERGRSIAEVVYWRQQYQQLAADAIAELVKPIDMVLHCPACGLQHIDAPNRADGAAEVKTEAVMDGGRVVGHTFDPSQMWKNPPHRSHLCHGCGHIWRPADVPTNGVQAVKTKGANDREITDPRSASHRPEAGESITVKTNAPGLCLDSGEFIPAAALSSQPPAPREPTRQPQEGKMCPHGPQPAFIGDADGLEDPPALTVAKAKGHWNATADAGNQWGELSEDERLEAVAAYAALAKQQASADAERWRWWRLRYSALCKMQTASEAGLDLRAVYVDSPEKMDAVTDAARAATPPSAPQAAGAVPVMTRAELVAAAESIGLRFPQVREQAAGAALDIHTAKSDPEVKRAYAALLDAMANVPDAEVFIWDYFGAALRFAQQVREQAAGVVLKDVANATENWMCEAGARQMRALARAALAQGTTPAAGAGVGWEQESAADQSVMLHNLLAVIHRDGGHYVAQHGLGKALADAHSLVINRWYELPGQRCDGCDIPNGCPEYCRCKPLVGKM